MTSELNRRDVLQAGLAGAVTIAMPAMAQSNFPSKPIKLICPWPAGGSTDGVMRALAESATRILGSPVVIENKAGASGMLGPNELVNAKPDGYTLSQLTMPIFRLPHMQKMQFNPLQDFTYIACLTGYTFGIQFWFNGNWHDTPLSCRGVCNESRYSVATRTIQRKR
jgi:tripartite-type tricarboxylate transporter receptor subunit TctC